MALKVHSSRRETLGTNHPITVNALIQLAQVYVLKGDSRQADRIHKELLDLPRDGRIVGSRMVVRSFIGLAGLYPAFKQWAKVAELEKSQGRRLFTNEFHAPLF